MKSSKLVIIISISFFFLTACVGNTSKQNTHIHEDGSVHDNHATEQVTPVQESFKVEADTTLLNAETEENVHSHDHNESTHKH